MLAAISARACGLDACRRDRRGARSRCASPRRRVPSAMRSPRYMANTRSTRAATLLTLWSTSSTARPSRAEAVDQRRRRSPTSAAVSPAKGSSTSTTFGSRAIALASSMRRRSAKGSVRGLAVHHARRARRARRSRARCASTCGRRPACSRLSGSSASLMFSSTVCRCSGRECWNTMPTPLPRDAVRRPAGDVGARRACTDAGIRPLDAHDAASSRWTCRSRSARSGRGSRRPGSRSRCP